MEKKVDECTKNRNPIDKIFITFFKFMQKNSMKSMKEKDHL